MNMEEKVRKEETYYYILTALSPDGKEIKKGAYTGFRAEKEMDKLADRGYRLLKIEKLTNKKDDRNDS